MVGEAEMEVVGHVVAVDVEVVVAGVVVAVVDIFTALCAGGRRVGVVYVVLAVLILSLAG